MQYNDNVVDLQGYQESTRQQLIDDIGARAFIFLRDEAQEHDLPMKEVLTEHVLGIALVVEAVEGNKCALELLQGVINTLKDRNEDQ